MVALVACPINVACIGGGGGGGGGGEGALPLVAFSAMDDAVKGSGSRGVGGGGGGPVLLGEVTKEAAVET